MEPIIPTIVEVAGHVIQPVDVTVAFSNVVTSMTEANRRPSMFRRFTNEMNRSWRSTANRLLGQDNMTTLVKLLAGDGRSDRPPAAINVFLGDYQTIAAGLMSDPAYVKDVGRDLQHMLTEAPDAAGWTTSFVSMPALGYPRPYLRMAVDYPAAHAPFLLPYWEYGASVPTTAEQTKQAEFRDMIADLCMLLDRPSFSDTLVPEASRKGLVSRDAREPFWGQGRAAIEQAKRLTAIGVLYSRQADAFALRFNQTLWQLCYDLAIAQFPAQAKIIEHYADLHSSLTTKIPCHPVLESIANLFANVTISTYYGVKKAVFRHGTPEEWRIQGSNTAHRAGIPAQLMMLHALAEHARMHTVIAAGENWPVTWSADVSPDLSESARRVVLSSTGSGQTFSEALQWLATYETYVSQWPEITRLLGWSGGVAATAYEIQAAGADFVLSDGDSFSATPVSVLSGLRPGLSLGNAKASGFSRRFSSSFGTGPSPAGVGTVLQNGGESAPLAFTWSVLPVRGHVSALDREETYVRFYMPAGMLMGEADVEPRVADPAMADPLGLAIVNFYRAKSPSGYVRHWYGEPSNQQSRETAEGTYYRTDWDASTESEQATLAQQLLITGYGNDNVEKQPLKLYVYRSHFNLRVAVQMSRPNHYEWYDEIGVLQDTRDYDGHVVFNDTITLTSDTGPVDQYVDLVRIRPPALPSPINEEVPNPV